MIDNQDQYNLDFLRQIIIDFTNQSNIITQLDIHTHKIMYFQAGAEKLQEFFCAFLQSKLTFLIGILNSADGNIDRFRGKIQVTNNNLTQSWNEKLKNISDIKNDLVNNEIFSTINFLDLADMVNSHQKRRTFSLELRQSAIFHQSELKNRLSGKLVTQLRSIVSAKQDEMKQLTSLENLLTPQFLMLDFSPISKEKLIEENELSESSSSRSESLSSVRDLDEKLVDSYNSLSKNIEIFQELITSHFPLRDFKLVIEAAVNSLAEDFDNYFDAITVYRTGIFSLGAKDAISKLGLGSQMDYLEANELTESKKTNIKQQAQECLFPNHLSLLNDFSKDMDELAESLDSLQSALRKLHISKRLQTDILNISLADYKLALGEAKERVVEGIGSSLKEIQEKLNLQIYDLATRCSKEWKTEIEQMREDRNNRIKKFIIGTCVTSTIVYAIFLYLVKIDFANNWATVLFSGLVINLISNPIGSWIGKITTNFPQNIKRRESELLSKLSADYSSIVNNVFDTLRDDISLDDSIIADFWGHTLISVPFQNWQSQRCDFHSAVDSWF